jgi:alanine racemase
VIVKSWTEISDERLRANYDVLRRAAGSETPVLAVVKANAYGHGIGACAPVLAQAGAEWLGIADVCEGIAVRAALMEAGSAQIHQPRVMVMYAPLRGDVDEIAEYGLTPVVWTRQQMEWLAEAVERRGVKEPFAVHVEIDTGMSRQGVAPGAEFEELLTWLVGESRLRLDGVMTHFASAEVVGSAQTVAQRGQFEVAMGMVAAAGLRPPWVHVGNTSMLDEGHSMAWLHEVAARVGGKAMTRAGVGLYGYCLELEDVLGEPANVEARVRPRLQPVMTWKTRVIGVRDLKVGDAVGYDGLFVANQPMRVALLDAGYADGLRRELSSTTERAGGWVMMRGQRAAMVGRVSMNLTTVDVSGIAGVEVGDEVVLLGNGVTADDHARLAGTIAYDILCGIRAVERGRGV